MPPGARCIVAVGCILAGDGDGGATAVPVVMTPVKPGPAVVAALPEVSVVVTALLLWLTAASGDGATGALAVPVGTVAMPTMAAALRIF